MCGWKSMNCVGVEKCSIVAMIKQHEGTKARKEKQKKRFLAFVSLDFA